MTREREEIDRRGEKAFIVIILPSISGNESNIAASVDTDALKKREDSIEEAVASPSRER